jgi:glucose/arabinose dehydrogenase
MRMISFSTKIILLILGSIVQNVVSSVEDAASLLTPKRSKLTNSTPSIERRHQRRVGAWENVLETIQFDFQGFNISNSTEATNDDEIVTVTYADSNGTVTEDANSNETASFKTLRIDCGARYGHTDTDGNWWNQDIHFVNGTAVTGLSVNLTNATSFPKVFSSYRSSATFTPLSYRIPVPSNSYYTVVFHFIELIYNKTGARLFNIKVENNLIPQGRNVDIFAAVGARFTPYIIRRRIYVSDGFLSINLLPETIANATISGLEIIQTNWAPVAAPVNTPASQPTGGKSIGITGFRLVYVPNNTMVMDLVNGTTVYASKFPLSSFSVQAINGGNVSSVKFLQNQHFEGLEPFSYCGDRSGQLFACPEFVPSSKNITVTVASFSGPFQSGFAYPNRTVVFRIVNGTYAAPSAPFPTAVTVPQPTPVPVPAPVKPSVSVPIPAKPSAPVQSSPTSPVVVAPTSDAVFYPILINAGGGEYTDLAGRLWSADSSYIGGSTYIKTFNISGTEDDTLYISERYGPFSYKFNLPAANYDVLLHFSENYVNATGERVFDIEINDQLVFENVDIIRLAGGQKFQAVTLQTTEIVSTGVLNIEFIKNNTGTPKVCGIEIIRVAPHLAHSVPGGPYSTVDIDGDGYAKVLVDGTLSHTHGTGLQLIEWIWKFDGNVVGTGEITNLTLPVGNQVITLFVLDDDGNDASDSTTVTVSPQGYPAIISLSPSQGNISGGEAITLYGSGFIYNTTDIVVHFGDVNITGSGIKKVNSNTIIVQSPKVVVATPVPVYFETPIGKGNTMYFTYVDGFPISFQTSKIMNVYSPTTLTFGPDERLYVGTINGILHKITFDANFQIVEAISSSIIADLGQNRSILGLAFDPMDTNSTPTLYISHSITFHGESKSSSGLAINGKISRISGANLDAIEDVITGLPVSDHDHAVNGLEFGDHGELYIQIGGNTNAGVVGPLSGSHLQKDNVLSSATLVANVTDPNFNGFLTYDAEDDGNLNSGTGVEIFAYGNRNPYDLVLHSNGYLYGTDNGADLSFGPRSIGCGYGEELPELEQADKINLLRKGAYYGHANRKRGSTGDPRQCLYHLQLEPSNENYTAPIVIAPSSANGIIEFQTNHFNGQLRGNLIYSQYKKGLYRVILTEDGTGVIAQSKPPIFLIGNYGLDVIQAPDGRLVEARYIIGSIAAYIPIEAATEKLIVKGVFPRRGSTVGGTNLNIYGVNFEVTDSNGTAIALAVTVGASNCPIQASTHKKIICTLPAGTGTVNITVATVDGSQTSVFERGYRYITGTL